MEGLFRQIGIYSPKGQTYRPVDADHLLRYHEDVKGQILEEGINEAGAFASWMAAGNAYASSHLTMVPFYIYYSMFGFQRTGDLAWAAADMGVRGFLMGATSGRTTLAGEGLQHQDGHQLVMANLIPNVISYDPCFSYELAVILQHGLKDMYELQRNVFYYITLLNENYTHPPMPEGVQEGIIKGIYPLPSLSSNTSDAIAHIHLMGSGAILREVIAAADDLWQHYHISSDLWSVTSFNELARDGMQWDRTSMMCDASLSVGAPRSYVYQCLDKKKKAPIVAATDYVRAYAEQIRPYLPYAYHVLGTDGFGRSDTRSKLRQFFEVDRASIVLAALWSLANEGLIPVSLWHTARSQHAHANQHTAPWMQ